MKNYKLDDRELDQLMAALSVMRESELSRLLNLIESLVQERKRASLHTADAAAAAVTAQRLLKRWNTEVQRILKKQRANEAAAAR